MVPSPLDVQGDNVHAQHARARGLEEGVLHRLRHHPPNNSPLLPGGKGRRADLSTALASSPCMPIRKSMALAKPRSPSCRNEGTLKFSGKCWLWGAKLDEMKMEVSESHLAPFGTTVNQSKTNR